MSHYFGIILALTSLVSWGFGDFFIQKTTRLIGSWKTLFFIGVLGCVVLFPFVKDDLFFLQSSTILFLLLLSVIVIFAALFDFEALRQGKIAIVEPILGLELPLTVGLSVFLANESLSWLQSFLIVIVFIGIVLAITTHHTHLHYHKRMFEKGVILAGIGAICMALTNFLIGFSSQRISPLMTIWFTHTMITLVCAVYLIYKHEFKNLLFDIKKNPKTIIGQSILDNVAWISYAKATTYVPIAIATTISESYIALAVVLGLFFNREKLKHHQMIGVTLAIIGVLTLSYFS